MDREKLRVLTCCPYKLLRWELGNLSLFDRSENQRPKGSMWLTESHRITKWNSDLPTLCNYLPVLTQTLSRHELRGAYITFCLSLHVTVCVSVTIFQWVQSPVVRKNEPGEVRISYAFSLISIPHPPPAALYSRKEASWQRTNGCVLLRDTFLALLWEVGAINAPLPLPKGLEASDERVWLRSREWLRLYYQVESLYT